MPFVWSEEQVRAGRIRCIIEVLRDKHLPTCYNRLTPLKDCQFCGGPERQFLEQVYAEDLYEQERANSLARQQESLF